MTLTGVPSVDAFALLPVIAPVVALILILLIDALVPGGTRWRPAMDLVALVGLIGAAAGVAGLAAGDDRSTACVTGGLLPQCSFVVSDLTLSLQAVILVAAIGCLLLTLDGPGAHDRTAHHVLLLARSEPPSWPELATWPPWWWPWRRPRCRRSDWSRCAGTPRVRRPG